VFYRDRWAGAFVNTLGANAGPGLVCLRVIALPVKKIRGALFGHSAALKIEKTLREAAAAAGSGGLEIEYAIRFITLLVRKNYFRHIDTILEKIETILDERRGILNVTAESAAPMNSDFQEELRRKITDCTGASEVKMRARVAPELLGGFRLRIGALCVDASLKCQLEQMELMLMSSGQKS
jgi:F-type H+-transporting ATPase subunit delta